MLILLFSDMLINLIVEEIPILKFTRKVRDKLLMYKNNVMKRTLRKCTFGKGALSNIAHFTGRTRAYYLCCDIK